MKKISILKVIVLTVVLAIIIGCIMIYLTANNKTTGEVFVALKNNNASYGSNALIYNDKIYFYAKINGKTGVYTMDDDGTSLELLFKQKNILSITKNSGNLMTVSKYFWGYNINTFDGYRSVKIAKGETYQYDIYLAENNDVFLTGHLRQPRLIWIKQLIGKGLSFMKFEDFQNSDFELKREKDYIFTSAGGDYLYDVKSKGMIFCTEENFDESIGMDAYKVLYDNDQLIYLINKKDLFTLDVNNRRKNLINLGEYDDSDAYFPTIVIDNTAYILGRKYRKREPIAPIVKETLLVFDLNTNKIMNKIQIDDKGRFIGIINDKVVIYKNGSIVTTNLDYEGQTVVDKIGFPQKDNYSFDIAGDWIFLNKAKVKGIYDRQYSFIKAINIKTNQVIER